MRPSVVIAGASSGIGLATAERFLSAGWEVAGISRRTAPLARLARRHPECVRAIAADLTRPEAASTAARAVAKWRPRLDALVTSAGDFLVAPIAATTTADFERIWRLTVLAKFLLVRELLPLLMAGRGRRPMRAVVHVASLAAHQDFADESAYASAMHGVIGLARSQDAELRASGIRVSVVSPGLVRTPLTERSGFSPAELRQALPAAAIAASILLLVETTRAGGYINEIFHVPGGEL